MLDKKKLIPIISIVVGIIIVIIAISTVKIIENKRFSAILDIVVVPSSATISLNGKTYTNGEHRMLPGQYQVEIKADGAETYKDSITLEANSDNKLYKYLTDSHGNIYFDRSNKDDETNLMTIMNYEATIASEEYAAQDPVLKITPYYDEVKNHYNIFARVNQDGKITIQVELNTCTDLLKDKYIAEAKDHLTSQGINPNKYTFEYTTLCD